MVCSFFQHHPNCKRNWRIAFLIAPIPFLVGSWLRSPFHHTDLTTSSGAAVHRLPPMCRAVVQVRSPHIACRRCCLPVQRRECPDYRLRTDWQSIRILHPSPAPDLFLKTPQLLLYLKIILMRKKALRVLIQYPIFPIDPKIPAHRILLTELRHPIQILRQLGLKHLHHRHRMHFLAKLPATQKTLPLLTYPPAPLHILRI